MPTVIEADGLSKRYGGAIALQDVSFRVQAGRIVGLIGRNGAGKTSALKAILGLTPCSGQVRVFGLDPKRQRGTLMREVCFIADTAVLPRWMRVNQAIEYVEAVHPRFQRARAQEFLTHTSIPLRARISELSKGMITQLHLALILAIDVRLLVLDEPTLGLDLIYRRQFYDTLLNDYFNESRTILLTTHQVEEIEHVLTDVLFIERGRILLDASVEALAERFVQLNVAPEKIEAARALKPFYERRLFGRPTLLFEGQPAESLAVLGEVRTPTIADLFVAKMQAAEA